MHNKFHFWLFWMFCIGLHYSASAVEYVVEHHLTVENGLPSNETYYSFNTADGDIWICTDEGLARFNGVNIRVYTQADGLAGKAVFKAVEDTLGKIWLITSGGISVLKGDSIYTPKFNTQLVEHSKFSTIKDLAVDKNGVVFISTVSPNTGVFKIEKGIISFVEFPESIQTGCDEQLFAFKVEGGSYLIGLLMSNGTKSCADTLISVQLYNGTVLSLASTKMKPGKNQYDMSLTHQGVLVNVRNALVVEPYSSRPRKSIEFDQDILTLSVLSKERNWNKLDRSRVLCGFLEPGLEGFDINMISDVQWYTKSNLSVCSIHDGVYLISRLPYHQYDLGLDLKLNRMSHPFLFSENKLQIYCDGFVYDYNLNEFSLQRVRIVKNSNQVRDRSYNYIWWQSDSIAWFNYARISISSNRDSIDIEPINSRGSKVSKVIWVGRDFFIAKSAKCLWLKKRIGGEVVDTLTVNKPMSKLFYINNQRVVISSADSVYVLNVDYQSQTILISHEYSIKNASAALLRGDSLIVGTEHHSVYLISLRNNSKNEVSCNLGHNESVKSLAFRGDSLFIGTNRQLRLVILDEVCIPTFITLIRRPVEQIYLGKLPKVFASSGARILWLDLGDFSIANNTRIVIDRVLYNGEPVSNYNSNSLKLFENDFMIIEPRLNSLMNKRKYDFEYRLHGRDSSWNMVANNQVWLSGIISGTYLLELKLTDGFRSQLGTTQAIHIEVLPDDQNSVFITTTSIALILFLFGIATYLIIYNRPLGINNNIQVLDLQFRLGTLKMNPHFLFNALNAIKDLLQRNKLDVANHFITSAASLMRDIIDASNDNLISLEDELKRVNTYLELERIRQPHLFRYKIIADPGLNLKNLKIPPMIIQPLVENSIWHGFSHMQSGGHVSIELSIENQILMVRVQDNGIGIRDSDRSDTSHTSEGLRNIKSRLDEISMIRGKKYNVFFKSNRERGVMVTLVIPQ